MNIIMKIVLFTALFALSSLYSHAAEIAPHDGAALSGLKIGKAVFDVRTNQPKALLFILKVVEQTEYGMKEQGVEPDFVLSFRGGTLPLLTGNPSVEGEAEQAILEEVRKRLSVMKKKGMVLEACNVAAGLFKIKEKELAKGLAMVGNSLISLIGYQGQGYALVPMY